MEFNELTEEQKAKVRAAKTAEEILALAREEGYELSDEQLEGVAGGWSLPCHDDNPDCGAFTGE